MKRIIPFAKDISLGTKISEITSISLEHNLKMENSDSVVGVFTINGKYKMNEISINEEVFENKINFDITLDDKYDASKVIIDVDDFYYEIINEEFLRVHIDVKVDNLIYSKEERKEVEKLEEKEEEKITEILTDESIIENKKEEQKVIAIKDNNILKEEIIEDKRDEGINNISQITNNITSSFLSTEEKYSTYKVHIIRENETINTVMEKYSITKEELEKYNSLENVIMGTKIIIPIVNE